MEGGDAGLRPCTTCLTHGSQPGGPSGPKPGWLPQPTPMGVFFLSFFRKADMLRVADISCAHCC
jgi:hypothetical protein